MYLFVSISAILMCCTANAVHRVAHLKISELHSTDALYTAQLIVDGVNNGKSVDAVIDTGSTGLVVPAANALRKKTSCKESKIRCAYETEWQLNFVTCYGDGAGYILQPDLGVSMTFGNVSPIKVTIGHAVGVFDPDGSMLTNNEQVFVSVFGIGAHGDHDCSFSQKDALIQLLDANSLPHIWSLRSLATTGEGRMYLGTSAPTFHIDEERQYTGLIQQNGKYSVVVSGLIVSGTSARSKPSKQRFSALECILDTSMFIVNELN